MADSDVAPGTRRANVSRRQVLRAAAATSIVPLPATHLGHGAWQTTLDAYRAAARLCEAFYKTRLRPAHDAMYAEGYGVHATLETRDALLAKYDIDALEKISADLYAAQTSRMRTLIRTPAPDLPAFGTKLEISYQDLFVGEYDYDDIVARLVEDARRLIG